MRKLKEYALYKGDNLIITGTIKQIAFHQGVKETTVRFWSKPASKNRDRGKLKRLVCLD